MEIYRQMKLPDYVVIVAYLVTLLGIGFWISYRHRESQDLFLGGRSVSWYNVGFSMFGTNVGPAFLIASCAIAYSTGMVAANFDWLACWCLMLLGMYFVPKYLAMNISTMPQFLLRRFGPGTQVFLSWYNILTILIIGIAGMLYSGGVLLSQMLGWPLWLSAVVMMAVAMTLTVTGGLVAIAITDTFQVSMMIIGSTALTVIGISRVGGFGRLFSGTPAEFWSLLRPAGDPTYPWYAMLLGYPVLGVWFWCTEQTMVQRVLGARDIRHAQLGTVFTGFIKIIPPFIFMLPGILCRVLFPQLDNPDKAYLTLVTSCLPTGLIGLMVSILIATLVSHTDASLNSFSTIVTLDIYTKRFRPNASPAEIKIIGRATTVGAALLAILLAISMQSFRMNMFDLFQSMIAFIAPPITTVFLLGALWRRATYAAAMYTLVLGTIASVCVGTCNFLHFPSATFWPHYLLMSFYLCVALCAFMVAVSLVTKNSASEEPLPTLEEAYKKVGRKPRHVWAAWGVLSVIMILIYAGFQILSQWAR
jgi:solute:Na+ symporter, SSS family